MGGLGSGERTDREGTVISVSGSSLGSKDRFRPRKQRRGLGPEL